MLRSLALSLITALLLLTAATVRADAITEEQVFAMVDRAVALLNEEGDPALATIGTPNGEFDQGELYVFVYDTNVVMLAHPVKPTLVGRSYKGKPDAKGKKFRDMIVENALNGGGWVDYVYQKPGVSGLHKKKVFSKLAEHGGKQYVVACGMYAN
ncbi:cache domain-containing protein [Endothiovibrio diazotrophicus]